MPTMTSIALERLLEPNADRSAPQKPKHPIPPDHHRDCTTTTTFAAPSSAPLPPPGPYFISSALYATPDPALLPNSPPTSISPSPYVVNRKGRAARPADAAAAAAPASRRDGFEIPSVHLAGKTMELGEQANEEAGLTANCSVEKQQEDGYENQQHEGEGEGEEEEEEDDDGKDDFLDPQDSRSVTSSCSARFENQSRLSNQPEFYDAAEDFFSDGSRSPSLNTNPEIELRALRLNLLEEIGRRKIAEEALLHMQNQWNKTAKYLSHVGVSFPAIEHAEDAQLVIDPAAICQEITVARFVSEAVERGLVRAEAEAAAEAVIHSKNHEISRLRNRVQYYEAVNREMSQRNQEIVELARLQRLRRKIRWRWLWGCIGLSISIGASLLAYSHVPHSGNDSFPTSCPDAPPGAGGSVENES